MKVKTNGVELFVDARGSGPAALICLHYWGGSSRTWGKVIDALPSQYQTVAIDFRGWGHSDAPGEGYALADMAADIEGVISALRLERYVLVGHSMGGKVAQLLASRHPQGLLGLVLVAPAPPPPLHLPAEARAMMATAYASAESVSAVIDQVLTSKPLTASDREQVIADSLNGAEQAKTAWPTATALEDISNQAAAIEAPMVIVAGENDRVETTAWLKEALASRFPTAAFHILPSTGHLIPLESPRELADIIDTFVAGIGGNAA